MISITDANEYFTTRLFADEWTSANDTKKTAALNTAENMINTHFVLLDEINDVDVEETDSYLHAVCEQALHLLKFSNERFQLQQEGVSQYRVDDISISMNKSLFSPVVKGFLNPIRLKAGDIC